MLYFCNIFGELLGRRGGRLTSVYEKRVGGVCLSTLDGCILIKSPYSREKEVLICDEFEIMKVKGIEDEKILREALARSQAFLNALPDLVFILNKDAVYLDYKAGGNGDLYRAPNDFLGKRVDEVLPADLARLSLRYISAH